VIGKSPLPPFTKGGNYKTYLLQKGGVMLHFTKGGNYKTYPLQKRGVMLHFTKGGSYATLYKRGEL